MHAHDEELIAALAEGALPPDEARRAEAGLAGCRDCREALADHRTALTSIRGARRPALDDLERARLHRAVMERVGARASGRGRFFAWGAAATAAAALLAGFVLLGPLFGGPGGAGPTAAQAPELMTRDEADLATEDTFAAAAPAEEPLPVLLGDLGPVDEEELRTVLRHPAFDRAAELGADATESMRQEAATGEAADLPCLEEAGELSSRNQALVIAAEATFAGDRAVVLGFAAASGAEPDDRLDQRNLWVLAAGDCRILHSQEGVPAP